MAGYIGKSQGVTQVDGYTTSEADSEFVNDPNGALNISSSASTDSATIDSSGNLLVGKTAPSSTFKGVEAKADGALYATRDLASGSQVGIFNRLTSNGDIVSFRKDGTTVGSIGSQGGNKLYVGSGDAGIIFDPVDDSLYPYNTSTLANRDASVDIGDAGVRFKNLYLSGGVYLGGTGSANYLDDYEEGTWTPAPIATSGSSTWSGYSGSGQYTKVGRLVYCQFTLNITSLVRSGNVGISGLPFSASGNGVNGGARDMSLTGAFFQLEGIQNSQINVCRRYDNGGLPDGSFSFSGFFVYHAS